MTDITAIVQTIADKYDVTPEAAEKGAEILLAQIGEVDNKKVSPDDVSDEDAEFIIEAYDPDSDGLRMDADLNDLGQLRDRIDQAVADLEGLYSDRAELIRRLADNGVRISSICEQAGLNRQRVYAIRKGGR